MKLNKIAFFSIYIKIIIFGFIFLNFDLHFGLRSQTSKQQLEKEKKTEPTYLSTSNINKINTNHTKHPDSSSFSNQDSINSIVTNPANEYDLLGGKLINNSFFLTFYRNSFVIETTGNEATFSMALRLDFNYTKTYNNLDFIFTSDFYFLEALSLRGRFYENFNPPVFYPNHIAVDLPLFTIGPVENRIKAGIMPSVFDVLPMKSYYLPVVFSVNRSINATNSEGRYYINHAMITGHRDHPIAYLITPHYDTGIIWQMKISAFEMLLGLSNGEMGLDSNSAKTIIGRFAYRDGFIFAGMNYQIGNIASVPIKENQMLGNLFFYLHFDHLVFGMEGMLLLHGLRDLGALTREVAEEFYYTSGFFTPFTVYNDGSYDSSSQLAYHMLYGFTSSLFFKVMIENLTGIFHASIYDPNLLSENKDIYQRRYRGFFRLGYQFTSFLLALFSYTFTYDPFFLNNSQYYDATEPRELHPIIDHDFFAGLKFSLH